MAQTPGVVVWPPVFCRNLETIRCVDPYNAAGWAGSDVGAWINAAYADLPSAPSPTWGQIMVAPKTDGTCYAVNTPISFSAVGKGVLLELLAGTCFTQASATNTFVTFNNCGVGNCGGGGGSPSQRSYRTGIIGQGATISGPGGANSAIGILIGGSNGAEGLRLEGFEIDGFNINLEDGGNAFRITVKDVANMNSGSNNVLLTHPSEIWQFEGGKIGSNTDPNPANCFLAVGQTRVVMDGTSLDSCQLVNNGANIEGTGVHFESIAGKPKGCGSTNPMVLNIRGGLALFDPEFWQDCTTGNGAVPEMLIDTGPGTGNAEYLSIFGGVVHVTDTSISEIIRQQGGLAVTVFGLQNNSADAYPISNGVVLRYGATGPTILGPTTTGAEGTSFYTPLFLAGTALAMNSPSQILFSTAAPDISSGFGTSPGVVTNNGTASFTIDIGTGGAAKNGVIGLPAAVNGWNVYCEDISSFSTTVFRTRQTGTTTTSATIGNFNSVALPAPWGSGDILSCVALAR